MGDSRTARRKQERLRRIVLVVLVSAVTLLFLWMIREFLLALLLAALLAGLLYPSYRKLLARMPGRKNLAAGIVVGLLVVLIVGPLVSLVALASVQAVALANAVDPVLRQGLSGGSLVHRLVERFPRLAFLQQYREQLLARVGELGSEVGKLVVGLFTSAAS